MNILCVKWGDKYSAKYVNILFNMVSRNITIPFDFHCYTDDPVGIDTQINIIPIPKNNDLKIWWNKLAMFQKDFLPGQKLYFDLDLVIQNNIECFITREFHKIKCYWKPDHESNELGNTPNNSSIMSWYGNSMSHVWDDFLEDKDFHLQHLGIDRFMTLEYPYLKTYPRGLIYSYTRGASLEDNEEFKLRSEYRVCLFHQYPKQEDHPFSEIVKTYWK